MFALKTRNIFQHVEDFSIDSNRCHDTLLSHLLYNGVNVLPSVFLVCLSVALFTVPRRLIPLLKIKNSALLNKNYGTR